MPGYPIGKITMRRIGVVWLLLFGMPLAALAQQTVPVTIVVESAGVESLPLGTPLQTSQSTSFNVLKEVLFPRVQTMAEKEQQEAESVQRLQRQPRVLGGTVRYERVDVDDGGGLDVDGNIYSTNVQLLWERDDFAYGFLIPFDFLDLDDFNAYRIGAVGFGQYALALSDIATLAFMVNGLYSYLGIDASGVDNLNTFGGGVGLSLTVDQGRFVGSGVVSYQFTTDDSDSDNDQQHLIKVGGEVGVRLGERAVVTLFGIWNGDVTDYNDAAGDVDDSYVDLGIEAAWNLSSTWRLIGGYKKVLALDDFASDMVFLGTLLRF